MNRIWTEPSARTRRRPTLSVHPFSYLGDNLIDHRFAGGLASVLAKTLAAMTDLVVVTHSMGRPSHPVPTRLDEVADYVLCGKIRTLGQDFTVELRLARGDNRPVCNFEIVESIDSLFDLREDIIARIANRLISDLHEARFGAECPSTWSADPHDLVADAKRAVMRVEKSGFARSEELLKRAIELEPDYAAPYAWMARLCSMRFGQTPNHDRKNETRRGAWYARRAIERDPPSSLGLVMAGQVESYLRRDLDTASRYFERALSACESDFAAWTFSSATMCYMGRNREARNHAERALRLAPLEPRVYVAQTTLAMAHYAEGDFEAAIHWARRSIAENHNYYSGYKMLAASLVAVGDVTGARSVAHRLRTLEPAIAAMAMRSVPHRDPDMLELFHTRLRVAGVTSPEPPHAVTSRN